MTYEIVNPSDPYSITGEPEAVCSAVLLLGEGQYGVKNAAGVTVLPLYAFWNSDAAEVDWHKRFGRTIGESFKAAPWRCARPAAPADPPLSTPRATL